MIGVWVVSGRLDAIDSFQCRTIFFFLKVLEIVKYVRIAEIAISRQAVWFLYKNNLDWGEGKIG